MLHNLKASISEKFGTQISFSDVAGISASRLNRIIMGWTKPTPAECARIVELLDIDREWAFTSGLRMPRPAGSAPGVEARHLGDGVKFYAAG